MSLAYLLTALDPPDEVGAPERHADNAAGRQAQTNEAVVAARDRAWAEAVRRPDAHSARQAFGQIMQAYTDRLVRFAYGLVRSADAAEDVVQEVFVRVWERRETIRPEQSLRAYLFTAVHRAALDALKRSRVETRYAERITQDANTETSTSNAIAVDEQIDADAIARRVQAAMTHLPERRQTALRLRYEEQLPFAEVAEVMGISEKAAKHLVARSVEELRGLLGV